MQRNHRFNLMGESLLNIGCLEGGNRHRAIDRY